MLRCSDLFALLFHYLVCIHFLSSLATINDYMAEIAQLTKTLPRMNQTMYWRERGKMWPVKMHKIQQTVEIAVRKGKRIHRTTTKK